MTTHPQAVASVIGTTFRNYSPPGYGLCYRDNIQSIFTILNCFYFIQHYFREFIIYHIGGVEDFAKYYCSPPTQVITITLAPSPSQRENLIPPPPHTCIIKTSYFTVNLQKQKIYPTLNFNCNNIFNHKICVTKSFHLQS